MPTDISNKTCQLFEYGPENSDRQGDDYLIGCLDVLFSEIKELSRPLIFNHNPNEILGKAIGRDNGQGLEVYGIEIYDNAHNRDLIIESIVKGEMYMSYRFIAETEEKTVGAIL